MAAQDALAHAKIQELTALADVIADLKSQGKRVVHCHGVFDLLHIGHVRHFQRAREHGDHLVVTLTPDQWVNKGPHRPAFTQTLRAEMLANLQCVDYVAINRWPTAVETIKLLQPSVFVKGSEYRDASKDITGGIQVEEEAVQSVGGALVFTDDITFSSTTLINRHLPLLPKEANDFVAELSNRISAEDVLSYLDATRSLKVLVIGETIIDEYNYCEALGKAGKEPILAVRFTSSEQFAGGILAVANHVAGLCDNVNMISSLGEQNSQEMFVRAHLNQKIRPHFLYMAGAPTIVKRRFIENYPFQKMFEMYLMNPDQNEQQNEDRLCKLLANTVGDYDLVIVTDYGHGMIGQRVVEQLCKHARRLAINTQANAGNHGFNTVSKYPRADYVCVSENEIRLEMRQRQQDLQQIILQVAARMSCQKVMITRGRQGLLCYSKEEGFCTVPPFANQFTDRVGAGDAVFAITSLCMAQNAPNEIMGLIGNAAGAMKVAMVGNRSAIDRVALCKYVVSLLKGSHKTPAISREVGRFAA